MSSHNSSHTITEEEFENVWVAYNEPRRANDELRRANDQLCHANQPIGHKVNIKAIYFEFRGKNSLESDPSTTSDFEALNADSDYYPLVPLFPMAVRVMAWGYLYPYPPHTHITTPKTRPIQGGVGRDGTGRGKLPSLIVAELE
ncbi:hypothetical protein PIB30_099496 [Stylosanthes scabra]|uniref:Uncharacterized protein n=1 Tax=Stylosanthes scabra TaxID=79078 RepID=A0ABU6QXG8_9FABA|nr:hypothetical protein [Stylosanthes scabra]